MKKLLSIYPFSNPENVCYVTFDRYGSKGNFATMSSREITTTIQKPPASYVTPPASLRASSRRFFPSCSTSRRLSFMFLANQKVRFFETLLSFVRFLRFVSFSKVFLVNFPAGIESLRITFSLLTENLKMFHQIISHQ